MPLGSVGLCLQVSRSLLKTTLFRVLNILKTVQLLSTAAVCEPKRRKRKKIKKRKKKKKTSVFVALWVTRHFLIKGDATCMLARSLSPSHGAS
jgi:hypothetical protein